MNAEQLKDIIEQWCEQAPERHSAIAFFVDDEGKNLKSSMAACGHTRDICEAIAGFVSEPEHHDIRDILRAALVRATVLEKEAQKGGVQ